MCCVGDEWLEGCFGNGRGVSVAQSPVLWVDFDNGSKRTHRRIDAMCNGYSDNDDIPIHYASMPDPPLIAHDLDSMLELRDSILSKQARLVIIDNLGLITGDIEENNAKMAIVMGNLRRIVERTGAAMIVIHHSRKGGANGGRAGEALRGHSSIEASLDLAIQVLREQDSDKCRLQSTKTRGVDVPVVTGRFEYTHAYGIDGNLTNDLATARFYGVAQVRGNNPIRDAIEAVLRGNPDGLTKGKLAYLVVDNLGEDAPGINKVRTWIDDLIAQGELNLETGENNAKIITF